MTSSKSCHPDVLAAVRNLAIDTDYLRHVIAALTSIGSSPLGFRTTGTPEDALVAEYVAAEMRRIGLGDVAVEQIEVDAWRFLGASVVIGETRCAAVSFGGVPPTPDEGIEGRLVDVADGRLRRLAQLDLRGAVALLDWRRNDVHPSAVVLELAERGIVGLIVTCPAGGSWYQSADALGGFDGHWPPGAPPMVLLSKEDGVRLRAAAAAAPFVRVHLDATLERGAVGYNVVGYLPKAAAATGKAGTVAGNAGTVARHAGTVAEDAGTATGNAGTVAGSAEATGDALLVVGAHHDAWFEGAFDNTSGVAAMLALAKALVAAGSPPRHTICFTSRTAEEYGIAGSAFDWCIGAWEQVQRTHPDWQTRVAFHLCLEATGHRSLRSVIEAPVELAAWARRLGRVAAREGWTPTGWRVAPPVAGTEQWPYLVSGIPGVAAYAWEREFGRTDYHTQFDTIELLDFAVMAAQTRTYALLLLEADADPDSILDHGARAQELAGVATRQGHAGLAAAAANHDAAGGRQQFTEIGRGLFALDADSALCLPHEQPARDLAGIEAAIAAVEVGQLPAAARALRAVGGHQLAGYLGPTAYAAHAHRFSPAALTRTWGGSSHVSVSENLQPALACLSRQPGARTFGPWVLERLAEARAATRLQLDAGLDAMTRSLLSSGLPERG